MIFISAAEQSADHHAAMLIHATLARCPQARFTGVAGPRMVEAGCEQIFDMTGSAGMLLGALRSARKAVAMLSAADNHIRNHSFNAAVMLDSPTLHLPLAGRAQAAGVPVMYYIAPQLWAWGAHRIYKIRHRVDRLAVILPFEEAYFKDQGINATYVGHPLAESVAHETIDEAEVAEIRGCGSPVIAILPGSRTHVVKENLPVQLDVARRIKASLPDASFGVSVANDQVRPIIDHAIVSARLPITPYSTSPAALIEAADLVLVTSGTSTLEVALHGKPMVVTYNASRIFYHLIGRWMIRTPFFSLPNILAQREIVPEFMPYVRSVDEVAKRAIHLLTDESVRMQMVDDLQTIADSLRGKCASDNAAKILLELAKAD